MTPARDTADAQLQRLLWLIPAAGRPEGVVPAEAAARLGTTEDQIQRDVEALTSREFYLPAGTAELITVEWTDRLRIHTTGQFGRPPRLTRAELVCVLLGLRMMEGGPRELIQRLEARLAMPGAGVGGDGRAGSPSGTGEAGPDGPAGGESTADGGVGAAFAFGDLEDAGRTDAVLAALRRARAERRPCRFGYLKPGADAPEIRRLHCYALVHAEGAWYAAGHDPDAGGHRNFRVDRILGVRVDGDGHAYDVPEDFDPGALLEGVRLFQLPENGGTVEVEVRYGAPVVPWVREQWVGEADEEGGYRVRHRVGAPDWVVRHVLQYGPDAEVVGPPEMREAVRAAATRVAEGAGADG